MSKLTGEAFGLRELVSDFHKVPEQAPPEARRVVSDSLSNISVDWKARWSHFRESLPHLAASIDQEVHQDADGAHGEVGPHKHKPQGRLGSFIELGTRTSGPHPGGFPASEAEEPNFEHNALNLRLSALE